jgi:hypothetical protein
MNELIDRLEALTYSFDGREKMRQIVADYEALQSQWVSVEDKPETNCELLLGYWLGEHWIWVEGEYDYFYGFSESERSALADNYKFTHYQLVSPPAKEQGS